MCYVVAACNAFDSKYFPNFCIIVLLISALKVFRLNGRIQIHEISKCSIIDFFRPYGYMKQV